MRIFLSFSIGFFILSPVAARASACPSNLASKIANGSFESLTQVDYRIVAMSLSMSKQDFRNSQELSYNGGPLMPCVESRLWETCGMPGNPLSEKRINGSALLTKDVPPVEVPLIGKSQSRLTSCIAFNPQNKQLIVLVQRLISWKVSGTSHTVVTSTNSYDGYQIISTLDF